MNQPIYSHSKSEDEVARLLRKTNYEQVRTGIIPIIEQYRSGKIGPYELGKQTLEVIKGCNWTVDEVRIYEREHGIYWNIHR